MNTIPAENTIVMEIITINIEMRVPANWNLARAEEEYRDMVDMAVERLREFAADELDEGPMTVEVQDG